MLTNMTIIICYTEEYMETDASGCALQDSVSIKKANVKHIYSYTLTHTDAHTSAS